MSPGHIPHDTKVSRGQRPFSTLTHRVTRIGFSSSSEPLEDFADGALVDLADFADGALVDFAEGALADLVDFADGALVDLVDFAEGALVDLAPLTESAVELPTLDALAPRRLAPFIPGRGVLSTHTKTASCPHGDP